MKVGRYLFAVVVVWIVRVACNYLFYGIAMAARYEAWMDQHPGVFRGLIPGFIATDLLFTLIFVYLWTRAGACFGGGVKGGAAYGGWIGLFFGLVSNLYYFFDFTFVTGGDVAIDTLYITVTVAVQGAIAGAIYKIPAAAAAPRPAV